MRPAHWRRWAFDVAGWSRTEKQNKGVSCYFGERQLADFLARTEILVCLLPLTRQTENILNAGNLARLPKGAFVINPGRGRHCNQADLLAALDSGHIAAAALDVFRTEPLAKNSPLWRHPRVHITPHIASMTLPASGARHVIDNITRFRTGQALTSFGGFRARLLVETPNLGVPPLINADKIQVRIFSRMFS